MTDKIDKDPDYINCPKFGNSIKQLLEKFPDGVPDEYIAKVMGMDVEDVKKIYTKILAKLRKNLKIIQ